MVHTARRARSNVLFSVGQVVATPRSLALMEHWGILSFDLLRLHVSGNWGQISKDDAVANQWAVANGSRILSSYELNRGDRATRVWVITEADRSSTCFLLPEEY